MVSRHSSVIRAIDRTASSVEGLPDTVISELLSGSSPRRLHGAVKAVPVGLRTHAEGTTERESHGFRATESARAGDFGDTARAVFQETPRGFDAARRRLAA